MAYGRRPKPTAIRRAEGNRGKRAWNHDEPEPPDALPRCPDHLSDVARAEWRRVARTLHAMGVLTTIDRAALAAYCQSYGRWVEAERKLNETPALLKTPSGYIQQSPWLAVANKQLELMGRYMTELGMTPAARSRVAAGDPRMQVPTTVVFRTIYEEKPASIIEAEAADLREKIAAMAKRLEQPQ
jgi:P27 family predicted phage terminase small subunit